MNNSSDDVEDPLKPLGDVYSPDVRQASFSVSLDDMHRALSGLTLHRQVPRDVRQLFETSKNLALYSWFVYRFHQAAELLGYTALELALKQRYQVEYPDKKPPMLRGLLLHAQDKKWIRNEGFSDRLSRARKHVQSQKTLEAIEQMDRTKESERMVDNPTEEEICYAMQSMDIVGDIVKSAANLRNDLAHGSKTLHPKSISTLRTIADVINQLFVKESLETLNTPDRKTE